MDSDVKRCVSEMGCEFTTTYRKSSSDVPPEEHGDNIDDVGLGGQGLKFSHCLDIPKSARSPLHSPSEHGTPNQLRIRS